MKTQLLTGASFALLSSLVVAQPDPNIGSLLTFPFANNNTGNVVQATLGFNFTFPGNVQPAGSVPNVIYIDFEGRISNDPILESDRFGSTFDFLNGRSNGAALTGSPLIAAWWDDIVEDFVADPNAGVYFFTDANVARITWLSFRDPINTYTAQIELRSNGDILLRYADVDPFVMQGIVGLSDASGASGIQDDLSQGIENNPGDGTIWESFLSFSTPTQRVDWDSGDVIFTSTGPGLYTLSANVTERTLAESFTTGPVCDGVDTLTFTPTAPGSYNQTFGSGTPEMSFGTNLNIPQSGQVNVPLMFPFTMPGGTVVNSIEVRADGHILEGGSAETFMQFRETVGEFENKLTAQIAPLWDSVLSPQNATNGGGVLVNSTATVCTISWVNVPEAAMQGSNTFQCQLFADGTIVFHYLDIDILNGQTDAIIGVSPGSGVASGPEVDLSAGGNSGSLIYEQFTGSVFGSPPLSGDEIDLGFFTKDQLTVTAPAVIDEMVGLSVGTANDPRFLDLFLFGFPAPAPLDLTSSGIPCDFLIGLVFVSAVVPAGTEVGFTLPNDPGLVGLNFFVQAALVDGGGISLTNGLDVTIGDVGI